MKKYLIITFPVVIWLMICLLRYIDKFVDYFILPIFIAIVVGIVTNVLHDSFEESNRLRRAKIALKTYEGVYDVYHMKNLKIPDECNYKVTVQFNPKRATLLVSHTGMNDYDYWTSAIKMDDMTFSYGEGNYVHPKKDRTPFGRIKIFIINNATINVDKNYLDMKDNNLFLEGAEKWQWRKSDT